MRVEIPLGAPSTPVTGTARTALEPSSSTDQVTIARDGRLLLRRPGEAASTDQAQVFVLVNWRKIAGLP